MGYYDDCLEHHGILGQKWGVRRFESANGTLTAAGKKRYTTDENGNYQKVKKGTTSSNVETSKKKSTGEEEAEEKKKGLTDKQKKMIIAGAAVAGTALAAYGGYKLYQLNNKAKEGLATDLHNKAVKNITEGRNMEALGDSLMGFDNGKAVNVVGKPTLNDNYNFDKGLSFAKEGAHQRHLGEEQAFRAKQKDFTLKEKYDYLKKGKTTDDDYLAKMHRELADKERANRAGIEKKYSDLRRQAELEAQKAAKAVQQTQSGNPYAKAPTNLNPIQKAAWNASVSLANKSRQSHSTSANKTASEASKLAKSVIAEGPKSFSSKPSQNSSAVKQAMTDKKLAATVTSFNAGKKAVSQATKIHGQTKFSQAAKANDDYVSQLLSKNAKSLSQYSMDDLKKLDMY